MKSIFTKIWFLFLDKWFHEFFTALDLFLFLAHCTSSRNNDQQEYQNQSKVIKTILKVNHEEPNNVGTNIVKVNGGCNIKKDTSNTTTNLEKVITSSKKKDNNNHESGLDDSTYDAVDYIVKAEPAIVTEDQLDSLSVYDDATCAVSLGGDLYESIGMFYKYYLFWIMHSTTYYFLSFTPSWFNHEFGQEKFFHGRYVFIYVISIE